MIRKIKWANHDILGCLELDFTKKDGSTYNTIVFAGENGTGKTTILETLATFLNLESIEPFEYIQYTANNIPYTITNNLKDSAHLGFHSRINEITEKFERITSNRHNNSSEIETDLADLRHYGFAYSKARSGFNTKPVKSSTTQQLDTDKYENDSKDDFTSIKQLLVDINIQDNAEWMKITESGVGTLFSEFKSTSKKYRFESAFNNFFDAVKFKGIDNSDPDEIKIIFEKHGKTISVDDLSTGEKQIVFRGTHLLKNTNGISGGIVLVDEPELSMHPKWQQKVLPYYRNLFTQGNSQKVQMFFATHSDYVLRSALEDRDNVLIVVLSDNNGKITANPITTPSILPKITFAETNYLAFGIFSPDYHIELYGYLQNKTGKHSISSCDKYIKKQTPKYDPAIHAKRSDHIDQNGKRIKYYTLPTYVRNLIDHPDTQNQYTPQELECSTKLLIELCK